MRSEERGTDSVLESTKTILSGLKNWDRSKAMAFNVTVIESTHPTFPTVLQTATLLTINALTLPRYGLGNYIKERPHEPPSAAEARVIADLSRAGKRLMGFCRTNLFKRLESSGQAFMQSIERHILRNFVYLHALENDQAVPIGTQDAELLDSRFTDADQDLLTSEDDNNDSPRDQAVTQLRGEADFRRRAAEIYTQYAGPLKRRFCWLRADRFQPQTSTLTAPLCSRY
jgi:hypothetical protein